MTTFKVTDMVAVKLTEAGRQAYLKNAGVEPPINGEGLTVLPLRDLFGVFHTVLPFHSGHFFEDDVIELLPATKRQDL